MTAEVTSSGSPAAGGAEELPSPSFDNVPWPVRPSPGINYNFVSLMYLAGSAIALLFYVLEKQILAPLLVDDERSNNNTVAESSEAGDAAAGDGGDPWKEFANAMEGMHLIFIMFVPCLLWSLVVRYYWLREINRASKEKKDN